MDEYVKSDLVAEAQPIFSPDELARLFKSLDLPGDPGNEEDRALLVEALNRLEQADGTHDFDNLPAGPSLGQSTKLANQGTFTPIRRATPPEIDPLILENVPTSGRELKAVAMRLHDDVHQVVQGTALALTGGILGNSAWESSFFTEPNPFQEFITEARRALHAKRPSLMARLWEVLKGHDLEEGSNWRVLNNAVNVQVHRGTNQWNVDFVFYSNSVLFVVGTEKATLQKTVATAQPLEFSETLLNALNGDVRTTELALKSVQAGISVPSH